MEVKGVKNIHNGGKRGHLIITKHTTFKPENYNSNSFLNNNIGSKHLVEESEELRSEELNENTVPWTWI